MENSRGDIPEAEKIPFSQRAKRVILCGIEMAIGYDAPGSIANQRLAGRLLAYEARQELPPIPPPTPGPGEQ